MSDFEISGESTVSTGRTSTSTPQERREDSVSRSAPRFLFVLGCERSGTTAALSLLNTDDRIVLGKERFKFIPERLSKTDFSPERFFTPVSQETNFTEQAFYGRLKERWDSGSVVYIGDKNPRYYRYLPHLAREFPDAKLVFLVRDIYRVASSYNVRSANPDDTGWPSHKDYTMALRDWNASLSLLRKFIMTRGEDRVFVAEYNQFFSGHSGYLRALYEYLELPITPRVRGRYGALTQAWRKIKDKPLQLSPPMIQFLEVNRDRYLETWCLQRCPRI